MKVQVQDKFAAESEKEKEIKGVVNMASIGGLSTSTSSSISSLRGYGGLASGMDRDELIEGMTSGTQTKITKQQQAKTKLEWEQQAYRDISDKMISFANKYTSTMSSATNLFSDSFWGAASTSVVGKNSKFIGVSGANKAAAANVTIMGVKQMAKNAQMMSSSVVSDRKLTTSKIETGDMDISTLAGKNLTFKVGDKSYSVSIPYGTGEPFANVEDAAKAINEAMAKVEVNYTGSSKKGTLADIVEIGTAGGRFTISSKGNEVTLTGGSAMAAMGYQDLYEAAKKDKKSGIEIKSAANGGTLAGKPAELSEVQTLAQRFGGKSLTFSYNGTSKSIELPSIADIANNAKDGDGGLEYIKEELQKGLDAAFGKGRVEVDLDENNKLSFKTTVPNQKNEDGSSVEDTTSTLSITGGSQSLMASHGGLGIAAGESNRLNLNTAIKNSGLKDADKMADNQTYKMKINDVEFEFTAKESISSIMNKINKSDAGVKISYMSMADKFVMESTVDGASGSIKIEASDDAAAGDGAALLFGTQNPADGAAGYTITAGQDAVVAVKYAGSSEVVELTRGSNSFSIDGLNVTAKGEFGYGEDGKISTDPDDAVTFETNVSSDKMVSAISDMVKEYNEILELVNSQLSTRPDSDYFPLTDEQKKEMSESEIKLWEEKAKAGILFGSSELRSLSDDLRWAILPKDQQAMEALGISVSSSWQDNGKLSFDETKFKAALEQDPDAVKEAFTRSDGIASNLKNTMDKYVKTMGATKGILIEKAGSTHAPTSMLNNSLKLEIDDVDKILENLKTRLKSEQDRYISQFTQLETLISQMNSQSSYLSGMGF